jgi:arsenite methyltransferase
MKEKVEIARPESSCCDNVSSCCETTKARMETEEEIKKEVRTGYAEVARRGSPCCGTDKVAQDISRSIGYTEEDLESVPEGANLGLGCGNPIALAFLKEGEVVLDLGSGVGFDCFLAANRVGPDGKVIGVDMTPEMLESARENARKGGYENVEFRLGEIENLPVGDNSIDVVISNCVINLVPDKNRVFRETFRVLKPGGRIMISDMVLLKELPDAVKNSVEAYIGCLSGAIMKDEYIGGIQAAGFQEVEISDETSFSLDCMANDPTAQAIIGNLDLSPEEMEKAASSVASIKVYGLKPVN